MKTTPDEIEELDEEDVTAMMVELEMLRDLADAVNDMMLEAEDMMDCPGDVIQPYELSANALGKVWNEIAKYNSFMDGGEATH